MTENTAAHVAETDTAAAIIAGIEIAGPKPIGEHLDGRFFTQIVPAGARVETFDLDALEEKLAAHPRRKTGTVHVQDAVSFIRYAEKHGLPCTEVYADEGRHALVGVINAHEESTTSEAAENLAGHGDHRAVLELVPNLAWVTWLKGDKQWFTQAAFAEHLEDNAADIVHPDAATMLEIAESFQSSMKADFKRSERLSSGVVQFRYEETQGVKAGHTGEMDVPTSFTVQLAPFVGADPVEVTARFRYRIKANSEGAGTLHLSYALLQPEEIARQAFVDLVEQVADAIEFPVFAGRPA